MSSSTQTGDRNHLGPAELAELYRRSDENRIRIHTWRMAQRRMQNDPMPTIPGNDSSELDCGEGTPMPSKQTPQPTQSNLLMTPNHTDGHANAHQQRTPLSSRSVNMITFSSMSRSSRVRKPFQRALD